MNADQKAKPLNAAKADPSDMKGGGPKDDGDMKPDALKGQDPGKDEPVPYWRLIRWGLFVVGGSWAPFVFTTLLSMLNETVHQFQVQLLGAVVSRLQSSAAPAHGGVAKSGLDTTLIPEDPTVAFEVLAAVTVLGIALIVVERVMTAWTDIAMLARLQRRVHDQLLRLGPSYHTFHAVGETTAIVSRFCTGAQMILRDLIAFPLVRGFALVTALALLLHNVMQLGPTPLSLKLALLAGVLSMPAVSTRIAKLLRKAFTKVRDADLAVTEELQNSLAQPLEVQLMGALAQRSESFDGRLRTLVRHRAAAAMRNELATQFQSAMPSLLQLGFLAYGVLLAIRSKDAAATGAVIAIHGLVPLAIQPLLQMVQYFNGLNSAWPQIEKVVEILEAKPDIVEKDGARDLPEDASGVELTGVTFAYREGQKPVLDGIDATFDGSKTTALVGASGSGKSTIFNLIARLSDPSSGKVAIGATDIRDVRLASLRQRVVRVAQFPLFIADTVRANFQLAKRDASDKAIETVCRQTGLWDVLVRVSGGSPLDFELPRDVSQGLSGGQRRLLAISRALLHKPRVLLLDEPSAGLDNLTLQNLLRFLRTETKGMTVLVVDHDIEGFIARIADRICVLENGKIAQSGTHDELMKRGGLYQRLIEAASAEAPAAQDENNIEQEIST